MQLLLHPLNEQPGQPEKASTLDLNEARGDGMAVASAQPHANLHLTQDR